MLVAGADRAGRFARDKLQKLASHPRTTQSDPVESAVASAITETEDVKGLPSLPMTGGSAVWMASGVYSVCHVIISSDRGLGIGALHPIIIIRSRVRTIPWRRDRPPAACHVGHIKRRPTRCYRAIPVDSRDGLRAGPLCSAPTVPFALSTLGEAAAAGGL